MNPGDLRGGSLTSAFTSTPWYGGDYNPEQWPRHVWSEDIDLMNRAGVKLVTVGVFSWAMVEPREGEYDFAWLDEVIDLLHAGGVRVDLATATASPPPWFSRRHPESLPLTVDGVRLSPGSRQAYCPSSTAYRTAAVRLARTLAERYGEHPALAMWHVNNEYGCHVARCYCDQSAARFRVWLEQKYTDIQQLNAAWGTAFWSQRYDSFDEILPPRSTPAAPNPGQSLDFDRFSSDELLGCYLAEKAVLREITPHIPVTTNFMGQFRGADYWRWAPHVDVVADDLYPDPADPDAARTAAMARDLMRSLGQGRPWLLMEQATSAVNWRPQNAPKAPGQMRALSYQAIARGADGILFFQWRQSAVGSERFHSAMLPHAGTDTRVWREVENLGAELAGLGAVMGTRVAARVAIVFDWDSWWAIERGGQAADTNYLSLVAPWHAALAEAGVVIDFVKGDEDLSSYQLIVAAGMYVATDAQISALNAAVEAGSTVVVTSQSAVVDESLHVRLGGYLGNLQKSLGIWIEEFAPLAGAWARPGAAPVRPSATAAPVVAVLGDIFPGGRAEGHRWSEAVRVRDAEILATFTHGALAGMPAITRRRAEAGAGWYVATQLDPESMASLVAVLLEEAGLELEKPYSGDPDGWVEGIRRGDLLFVVNHGSAPIRLTASGTDILTGTSAKGLELSPHGVAVIA